MRKLLLGGAICALALVSGAALAQSDRCEGLQGATPGLYGLCIAFHNVEPCVPNPLMQDPFAGCEPKDGRLLEAYNNLKGPDDPRMPGTGDDCPCFTASDISDVFPTPHNLCVINREGAHRSYEKNHWQGYISGVNCWNTEGYTHLAQVIYAASDDGELVGTNRLVGSCTYVILGEDAVSVDLRWEQAMACQAHVLDAIGDGTICETLECDPDDPECPL